RRLPPHAAAAGRSGHLLLPAPAPPRGGAGRPRRRPRRAHLRARPREPGGPMTAAPTRRRVAARLAAAVTAAVLTAAGCVSLPDSGPVNAADPVPQAGSSVALLAYGPTPDATANQIVQGFLRAVAAGAGDEFAVAREYLAGPAAETWNPRAQVRVYTARDITYSQAEDGAVRASAVADASVDAQGRYTEASPDSVIELDFTLARTADGQWRI